MKYLVIIFSLYMTMLTLIPCQDKEDYANLKAEVSSLQKQSKGIEHNGHEICPPFCTCACCSVSKDFIQANSHGIIVNKVQTQYSEYKMPAIAEQYIKIYQPPQIV